jgi:hypothetical protein
MAKEPTERKKQRDADVREDWSPEQLDPIETESGDGDLPERADPPAASWEINPDGHGRHTEGGASGDYGENDLDDFRAGGADTAPPGREGNAGPGPRPVDEVLRSVTGVGEEATSPD